MIRNWHKILGYQALLAAAMFAGPVAAEEQAKKSSSDQGSNIDWKTLKELLDHIDGKIGSLDDIKKDIGGLKKEIELMRQANGSAFTDLDRRIAQLEGKMKSLETRLSQTPTRTANFPQTNGSPPAPAPAMGRLRLVNSFPSNATVFLNDVAYRLEPGRIAEVTLPAGPYNFWVAVDGFAMVQPPTAGMLAAGASRTIEIFNR